MTFLTFKYINEIIQQVFIGVYYSVYRPQGQPKWGKQSHKHFLQESYNLEGEL